MALLGTLLFIVLKWLVGTIIGRGVLLALAARGIRPEEWVAQLIHAAPKQIEKPTAWIVAGLIGLALLGAWDIFHIDNRLGRIWSGEFAASPVPAKETSNAPPATPTVSPTPVVVSGSDNVVSVGQIGGITAKTVTINPPMTPELRILGKNVTDNPDGSRTVIIETQVSSPITLGLLTIQIRADNIKDASIMAAPAADGISRTHALEGRGRNSFSAEIQSPHGQYSIMVRTAKAVPIELNAKF